MAAEGDRLPSCKKLPEVEAHEPGIEAPEQKLSIGGTSVDMLTAMAIVPTTEPSSSSAPLPSLLAKELILTKNWPIELGLVTPEKV